MMESCNYFLVVFVVFCVPISAVGGMTDDGGGKKEENGGDEQRQKGQQISAAAQQQLLDEDDRSFSFPHVLSARKTLALSHNMARQHYNFMFRKTVKNLKIQIANENGTLETFHKKIETTWEIYRQRDNSGKYIKFRLVNRGSGRTQCQWVVPKPNNGTLLTLFFNNNQSVPFHFNRAGIIIDGKQKTISELFDPMKIERLSKNQIDQLIANSAPLAPILTASAIPPYYPSNNIYKWHKMPLPVHPQMLKLGRVFKVGEVTNTEGSAEREKAARFDQITEQLDDGQNWVHIEVRQGQGQAKYIRNLFGDTPNLGEPLALTLFFDGAKRHFDWNGTALSEVAFYYGRESEWGKAMRNKAVERAMDKLEWAKAMEAAIRHAEECEKAHKEKRAMAEEGEA